MKYFESIPSIQYPFYGKLAGYTDDKLTMVNTVDLMIRFRIREDVSNSPLAYYVYKWKDGDRPDKVASLYYGDSEFAWLVMLSASAFDWLYEFPMSQRQFLDYIESKYGSLSVASSTIHHYEDGDGHVIDLTSYTESTDLNKRVVYALEFEEEVNEDKRNVKLLSKEFLPQITREYSTMLKSIKESRDLLKTQQVLVE
jgi:hypothetical protein